MIKQFAAIFEWPMAAPIAFFMFVIAFTFAVIRTFWPKDTNNLEEMKYLPFEKEKNHGRKL